MNENLQKRPLWIDEAFANLGVTEIKGSKHNPKIIEWLRTLKSGWKEDETPWCGTFIAQCLKVGNRAIPKHWYRALAYNDKFGTRLKKPAYGCIGVMKRYNSKKQLVGGHVTFIVGVSADGQYYYGIGGNQSDAVNIMRFSANRFDAFVWPPYANGQASTPNDYRYNLPIRSGGQVSIKES